MEVGFYKGIDMHTYKPKYGDEDKWVLPKGTKLDDNKLYIVQYKRSYPSDPCDCSSFTSVYKIEEVPDYILEARSQIKKYKTIIDKYKKDFNE